MLFYAGVTSSIGDVDKGTTVTDFLAMERDRGITISSAAISFSWRNHLVNLVDTPGHVDFTVEVERSVRVLDGAVAILDAVHGVQAQTETVWRQADRYGVPRIALVNKYDREGASLSRTLAMMRDRLGARPVALQLPVGEGVGFRGVVDVLRMELLDWPDTLGSKMRARPLSASDVEYGPAVQARVALFEALCEVDEPFLERYLQVSDEAVPPEQLFKDDLAFVHQCIRRATIALHLVPCLVGAAFRNRGIQPVLDAVLQYLPSPLDVHRFPEARSQKDGAPVQLAPDDRAPLVCLAWKVMHHEQMGLVTYFRVVSGTLHAGKMLINVGSGVKERPNKVALVHAAHLEQVPKVTAGNIGALVGLKHVSTGDTLMAADAKGPLLLLAGVRIPPPVFFRAIEPQSVGEQKRLDEALALLHQEDPSFVINVDADTGQTLVGGMGELHLEYLMDRLLTHYGVTGVVGRIMIAYRCAARTAKEATLDAEHDYETPSGKRTYGRVRATVRSRPLQDAAKYARVEDGIGVDWKHVGTVAAADKRVLQSFSEGVLAGCARGAIMGFPIVNLDVMLLEWHTEGDLNEAVTALRVCGEKIVRRFAESQAPLALLEPAMQVEFRVEEGAFGAVMADVSSARRGEVEQVSLEGREKVAHATVPLKEMIGYRYTTVAALHVVLFFCSHFHLPSRHFRSLTAGKGSFAMQFSEFRPVSDTEYEQIVAGHT